VLAQAKQLNLTLVAVCHVGILLCIYSFDHRVKFWSATSFKPQGEVRAASPLKKLASKGDLLLCIGNVRNMCLSVFTCYLLVLADALLRCGYVLAADAVDAAAPTIPSGSTNHVMYSTMQ
jgi:hypothetical protein